MALTTSYDELFGQIAGLTSLRDADLLEFSLLKTVFSITTPIETSILSLNKNNEILNKFDYNAEYPGIDSTEEKHSDGLIQACINISDSTSNYTFHPDGAESLTIFKLNDDEHCREFLIVTTCETGLSQALLDQLTGMLKIYQNFRQLLKESQTDELTSLSNRKSFESTAKRIHSTPAALGEAIPNERRQINNPDLKIWITMIDIDHFKKINDHHGHLIGDEVLVRVAQSMKNSLRKDDFLFRYGGEEFAAIISAKNKDECLSILERVRKSVSAIQFNNVDNISISLGTDEFRADDFYLSTVERADKALYSSKNQGRNRVTFYEDMSIAKHHDNTCPTNQVDLF